MARSFSSTDVVNLGSGAAIDAPFAAGAAGTIMLWIYPDAIPPATVDGTFIRKNNAAGTVVFNPTTGTIWQIIIPRATTTLTATATYANTATLAANKYCCVAATWDTAGANGDQQLWHGDLSTPIAEVAAYATQRVGTGTVTDTSALDFLVGNNSTGVRPMQGKIIWIGVWNRRLSLTELIAQQWHPHVTSDCATFNWFGLGPTTDADWSGNANNGAVTGTSLFPNAPLLPFYGGFAGWRGAFTAAAAGKPWLYYAQQRQQAM